jgi:hypothetical protein
LPPFNLLLLATLAPMAVRAWVPTDNELRNAEVLFHEVIGIGWYHLRLASGT